MVLTSVTFLILGINLSGIVSTTTHRRPESFTMYEYLLFLIDRLVVPQFAPEFVKGRIFRSVLADSAMPMSTICRTFRMRESFNSVMVVRLSLFPRFRRFENFSTSRQDRLL